MTFRSKTRMGGPVGPLRVRTSTLRRPVCILRRGLRVSTRASQADISASSENSTPPDKSVVYSIDNDASEFYTRISVNGENQPGLLSSITGVFANMGIDVRKAEVATQGNVVNDSFYVVDNNGNKIEEADLLSAVEAALNAIAEAQAGSLKKQRRPSFVERGTESSSIKTELMSTNPRNVVVLLMRIVYACTVDLEASSVKRSMIRTAHVTASSQDRDPASYDNCGILCLFCFDRVTAMNVWVCCVQTHI